MPEINIVDDKISLSGDWLVSEVRRLYKDTPTFSKTQYDVDLSDLKMCDSAGLALLVHWSNLACDQSSQIMFLNCPNELLEIARISGLNTLFESAAA
jgi:phospholipid transport system transporter-binding protein